MRCRMLRFLLFIALVALLQPSRLAYSTPEFSDRTSQGCTICHLDPDAGELSKTGLEFAASGYVWPPTGGYRVLGPIRKTVRFGVGLLHILASFMWFGTILYVQIMLRPAYAAKGLPKGEVAVGLLSMAIAGDMTSTISRAPHGVDKLEPFAVVGTFDAQRRPPQDFRAEGLLCGGLPEPWDRVLGSYSDRLLAMGHLARKFGL